MRTFYTRRIQTRKSNLSFAFDKSDRDKMPRNERMFSQTCVKDKEVENDIMADLR